MDSASEEGSVGQTDPRRFWSAPASPGETARVAFSGPLIRGKDRLGSAPPGEEEEEEAYVEITLDVREDSIAVSDVRSGGDGGGDMGFLKRALKKRPASLGSQLSFKIKQVSKELKRMTSAKAFSKSDRTSSAAARALLSLRFMSYNVADGDGWSEVEQRFRSLAVDGTLHRSLFAQCIGMKESKEFAGELFDALARRRRITSASITIDELREYWEQLSNQSFDSRLQTFFDMVDKNADGRITEEEVKEIISLSASANKLSKIGERAGEYAAFIMEELDPDNVGYIELQNLEMLLLEAPSQSERSTTNSRKLSKMLSQKLMPTKEPNPIRRGYRELSYFLQDNWKRVWVMAVWLSLCAALFAWKFVQYRHRVVFHLMGYCVATAKGAAETLKFNMAFILLPVCRNTITWLRSKTKLGRLLPFDDNINFHKIVAAGIAVGVALHALAHLTCDFPRLLHATDEEYEPMAPLFGQQRPPNYWWFLDGVEGWTGIVMVVLMAISYTLAQPWFRRNKAVKRLPKLLKKLTGFNAFWYSHHLFLIVYVLFVIHGFYLYLTNKWYEKTVTVYPGNVLALRMSKPQGFKYKSGQYIFINCADVSPFEWHPFSITSAPNDDYLSVHIRTAGDWTSRLRQVFSECRPPGTDQSGLLRADLPTVEQQQQQSQRLPRLLIDGAYGAPAQDYSEYDVLLLVGLGIGATPLISILRDVLNNIITTTTTTTEAEDSDLLCKGSAAGGSNKVKGKKKKCFATKRAYFYWVTREEGSFEWFKEVMNDVAEKDKGGVIELHNYCTSVYEEGDARSALIAMLQSLHHAKNGVDIVSGTRVMTHFARPNWRSVFKHVAVNHHGQCVGVFYCGPQGLTRQLRKLSRDFTHKTSTQFDFHKENF
ncbi:hypothetical protein H6P81_016112 [Aristolochia fimbriata]|uniref:Uncharacterized protein n=1 Tax=Aristolochia fimbriata TaxID=158543 RepID=A0AAV7E7F0_ARIFI|nr:hypothetical protein H6P81_016112 [Aristolochia fimbriata]